MTVELLDKARIGDFLRRDIVWGAYALADLEEPHFSCTRWFANHEHDVTALVMTYAFERFTTLMPFGRASGVTTILQDLNPATPIDLHLLAGHCLTVLPMFDGDAEPYLRLAIDRDTFSAAAAPPGITFRQLVIDDVPAAQALYLHYPDNHFEPERLAQSPYLGAFDHDRMIGIAGTHVASHQYRIAAVGDIVTAPVDRGRGVGAAITSALCKRLFESVDLIVLNVAESNAPARRVYGRLGFGRTVKHIEGFSMRFSASPGSRSPG